MRLKVHYLAVPTHFESSQLSIFSKRISTLMADSTYVVSDTLQGFENYIFEIILVFL